METFDVVVVGFGGAGAAAAIEAAAEGARVLVVDRFDGGGATALSGGVFYAGGGTEEQRAAGVEDTPEAMYRYLRDELEDGVDDATLRAFCAQSAESVDWLRAQGLRFTGPLFPDKTSQPPDGYGLYYSGNEKQRAEVVEPAARGHVAEGRAMTGHAFYGALRAAAERSGATIRTHTRADGLLTDPDGRVVGVELYGLDATPALRFTHRTLGEAVTGLVMLRAGGRRAVRALESLERKRGQRWTARARGGVVLAAGGFVFDAEMLAAYAPAYAGCMPLGTAGDDGAGIRLGLAVGAATREMDRCAASRFIAPPESFVRGVLVDGEGRRLCDETLYGATLSRHIAEKAGGRAHLVIDHALWHAAREDMRREEPILGHSLGAIAAGEANHLVFRKWSASANLHLNRKRAGSLAELERACGMPAGVLTATVDDYNRRARAGEPDAMGKDPALRAALTEPPFYAIDCSLDSKLFPGPCLTLGGLSIEGLTGRVLDRDGRPIAGLYAAGRNAAGVCARSYVSGLSLADCVFSGRNAGREAARAARSRP